MFAPETRAKAVDNGVGGFESYVGGQQLRLDLFEQRGIDFFTPKHHCTEAIAKFVSGATEPVAQPAEKAAFAGFFGLLFNR